MSVNKKREKRPMLKYMDSIIAWGLVSIIILAALAQGVVEPWSQFLLLLLLGSLFMLWLLNNLTKEQLTIVLPSHFWPIAILTIYSFVQGLVWKDADGHFHSLSIDAEATQNSALMLIALLIATVIGANYFNNRKSCLNLLNALTCYGFLLAIVALVHHFRDGETAYWPRPISSDGSFGPFINRDHFAGYLELIVPIPLAFLVTRTATGQRRLVYSVMATLMGVALIFTLSRGGMISLIVQLLILAAYSIYESSKHTRGANHVFSSCKTRLMSLVTVSFVGSAIIGGIFWIGAEPVIERLALTAHDPSGQQTFRNIRGTIWRDTWRIFQANPLFGTGLGAYETAFPQYAMDDGAGGVTAQAHNDYLQILADAGLIGASLAVWFLIVFIKCFLRTIQLRDHKTVGVALGCGVGVGGLLVHSIFDFNLQLPSHSLLFLVLVTCVERLASPSELLLPNIHSFPVRPDALVEGVPYDILH